MSDTGDRYTFKAPRGLPDILAQLDINEQDLIDRRAKEDTLAAKIRAQEAWLYDRNEDGARINGNHPLWEERRMIVSDRREELMVMEQQTTFYVKQAWDMVEKLEDAALREQCVKRLLRYEEAPF